MNIQIQAVNFNSEEELENYVEKKLQKINQFYDKIIGVNVKLKLLNSQEKDNKFIEIILDIPGNSLIVKKQGRSFEEATDIAEESLKKMIKREKEKKSSH